MTTTHVKDQHFCFPGGSQPSAEKANLKRKPSFKNTALHHPESTSSKQATQKKKINSARFPDENTQNPSCGPSQLQKAISNAYASSIGVKNNTSRIGGCATGDKTFTMGIASGGGHKNIKNLQIKPSALAAGSG